MNAVKSWRTILEFGAPVYGRGRSPFKGLPTFLAAATLVVGAVCLGASLPNVVTRPATPSAPGQVGFRSMPASETGLAFTNSMLGDLYLTNAVAHNGAGVAIGDVDGDGWPDIYLCNLEGPNRLFRNRGQWRFDPMDQPQVACADQRSTGAALVDVDGDRDIDLLVNGIGVGTRLFLNDGQGHFTEKTGSGLSNTASATSLALADIDGDGDLDLYCTHFIDVMRLADPTTRDKLVALGLTIRASTPDELGQATREQFNMYRKLIQDNQIKAD